MARKERKLTQEALADLSELEQSDISKIETGRILTTTGIARLARALRVPDIWLEKNVGPTPDWDASESVPTRGSSAHPVSGTDPMIPPNEIEWRDVMTGDDEQFTLRAKDDSMRPLLERGQRGIFDRKEPPIPGKPVLVVDRDGELYIREFRPRTKEHWQAVALHGHDPLDSVTDGLKIVATMVGVLWA